MLSFALIAEIAPAEVIPGDINSEAMASSSDMSGIFGCCLAATYLGDDSVHPGPSPSIFSVYFIVHYLVDNSVESSRQDTTVKMVRPIRR